MHEGILRRMRERVRLRQHIMTLHGEEEMDEDDLTIFDAESAILTGEIYERQRDQSRVSGNTSCGGQSLASEDVIVVAKLGSTGKLVIITIHRP